MLWIKAAHIASAIVWLGNFVVTGVWALRAFLTRSPQVRRFAAREILFTDIVFTLVFGTAVVVSGIVLASSEGIALWATFWTRTAILVVAAAAAVWAAVLLPLEIRMDRSAASSGDADRLFLVWNAVGWSVTIALFAVIFLMVQKPA